MRYQFGEFVIDGDARELRRGDDPVHLTPKAFDLLAILVAERPRVVSKQRLQDMLWPDTFVVDANLPVLVSEIRRALGDEARSIVRTATKTGYAFAASVSAACLHFLQHGTRELPLAAGRNIVGRDPHAHVCVASPTVSREHAAITVDGAHATIVDLDSKNGTRVAGRDAKVPTELSDGVVVQIGKVELIYRCPAAASETESVSP